MHPKHEFPKQHGIHISGVFIGPVKIHIQFACPSKSHVCGILFFKGTKNRKQSNQDGEKTHKTFLKAGITSQASRPGAASEETPRSPEANPSDSAMAVVPRAD